MNTDKVLKFVSSKRLVKTTDISTFLNVSRQYASQLLSILVNQGVLIRIGSTRNAQYTLPKYANEFSLTKTKQRLSNKKIKEHEILENFLASFGAFKRASENIQSILRYAFSEMLNNAIEHSKSPTIEVEINEHSNKIQFTVNDVGIGAFRNVMKKRRLKTELEAMQDLLKGKTTTDPKAHSGEGIFFTSKAADQFVLESFGRRMVVDNIIQDVFFEPNKPSKKGTRVIFSISNKSKRHLSQIFKKFQSDPQQHAFDKTEIHVRLFTMGTIYVSRSQARRILTGLEKFASITLDFERVPTVGQAFTDEIFRVFKIKHPNIQIKTINANEGVKFMIERAQNT